MTDPWLIGVFTVHVVDFFWKKCRQTFKKQIFSTTHMEGMSYMSIVMPILDQKHAPAFQMISVPINFFSSILTSPIDLQEYTLSKTNTFAFEKWWLLGCPWKLVTIL